MSVWGMVAGLIPAAIGSSEWARGRLAATGGPRQMSTHQRAYARDESEKLSDQGQRRHYGTFCPLTGRFKFAGQRWLRRR